MLFEFYELMKVKFKAELNLNLYFYGLKVLFPEDTMLPTTRH